MSKSSGARVRRDIGEDAAVGTSEREVDKKSVRPYACATRNHAGGAWTDDEQCVQHLRAGTGGSRALAGPSVDPCSGFATRRCAAELVRRPEVVDLSWSAVVEQAQRKQSRRVRSESACPSLTRAARPAAAEVLAGLVHGCAGQSRPRLPPSTPLPRVRAPTDRRPRARGRRYSSSPNPTSPRRTPPTPGTLSIRWRRLARRRRAEADRHGRSARVSTGA